MKRLLPGVETVSLRLNDHVFRAGDPVHYVYFPHDAVISLVATMEEGRSVEVSLTGPEGILGIRAVLGRSTYWYSALVQIPGTLLRIKAEIFKAEFQRGGALQIQTLQYLGYLLAQVSQNVACNRLHLVKQRLARRLLMIQDRVERSEFPVTHEVFASMLGAPRSDVSIAAEDLRRSGIIAYARGKLAVLKRAELEEASCECYKIILREFLHLEPNQPSVVS
jgi:CRP-like cAMP-binding protein